MMKKRLILAGLLGLELLSIPATAQMVDHVSFEAPQKAIAVPVPTEPGMASFMVMSNAPFAVIAQDTIGEFKVEITSAGTVNGNVFGENAQMPGDATRCSEALTPAPSAIYRAVKRTAQHPGPILTQAVRVNVRFDPATSPTFDIQTQKESRDIARAAPCASEYS